MNFDIQANTEFNQISLFCQSEIASNFYCHFAAKTVPKRHGFIDIRKISEVNCYLKNLLTKGEGSPILTK